MHDINKGRRAYPEEAFANSAGVQPPQGNPAYNYSNAQHLNTPASSNPVPFLNVSHPMTSSGVTPGAPYSNPNINDNAQMYGNPATPYDQPNYQNSNIPYHPASGLPPTTTANYVSEIHEEFNADSNYVKFTSQRYNQSMT